MGKTPDRNVPEYYDGSNIWVSIRDMVSREISESKEHLSDEAVRASGIKKVKRGTVIMSFKLTVGKCAIAASDLFTNEAIMAFNVKPGFDVSPYFLVYYLQGYKWSGANKAVMGMTLNKATISQQRITLPPLSIQQRIVSELDLLSSILDKQKAQLKEMDNLAQSIFYDMFGDPVENEKGWEVKKLGEVCDAIGDGLHGTPSYDKDGDYAFINGNNLMNGYIVITEKTQYVNTKEADRLFIKMNKNTILLSINGTLGKTAVFNNEKIVLGKSACYCNLKNEVDVTYGHKLMDTPSFLRYLEDNSSQSTIKNVGLKAIRNFPIILPPLALQQEFASKIQAIESQKVAIAKSMEETQKLFDYTMDKYFG